MSSTTRRFTAGIALLLIGLFLILAVHLTASRTVRANPGVLYAAPTAQGNGNCSNWDNACTVQTALAQAQSGDEIWVRAGVHYPGTTVTATFALTNGVALYGGFAGMETQRDERNWQSNLTVLSGDVDHNDITDPTGIVSDTANIQGNNAYHVITGSGTDNTAVLDGLVITAGKANGTTETEQQGGGMININGSPTVINTTFVGNAATQNGGGMRNYNSTDPKITNVIFRANAAQFGGAMSNHYSNPDLKNVVFVSNSATHNGGGLDNYFSSPTVVNAVFSGNTAQNGGAVYNTDSGSQPQIINVTFSGNSATNGGGMCNVWNSQAILVNVILWGNSATNGPQIYNANNGTATVSYSNVQGGWAGAGNINTDPLFMDADGADNIAGTVDDNLRLEPNSPCIDAGNNLSVLATTDLDGNPRFVDIPTVPDTGNGTPPIVDMGAYEAQYADVTLSKAVLPFAVAPGQAITFTLTLSNDANSSIASVGTVVTDTLFTLLDGATVTSTLSITDTGHLPPYVWQVQDLAPGQGGVITISGVLTLPLAAGTYTNTAFISAAGDLLAENNAAVITFTVPNVAPAFASAPVLTATQDAPYTYTATAGDDNGDALTITAPVFPSWLTLVDHGDGTATLSGTPTNADVGDHPVALRVADSSGLSDMQAFTITVANVNDAPFFTSAPVLTVTQDAPYTYAVTADDPDLIYGDGLTITAPVLPSWLMLDWTPGALAGP